MPGCVLRVDGTQFDPDGFLANSALQPYKVWHCGDPLGCTSPHRQENSGFCCDVSNVDGQLSGQVQDAIGFLKRYRNEFVKLDRDRSVEACLFDFGIDCRLDQEHVVVQGEYFPVDFLRLVGELGVAVAISLYPPFNSEFKRGCD